MQSTRNNILIFNTIFITFLCVDICFGQTGYGTLAGTQGGNTNSYFGVRAGVSNIRSNNSFFGYHSGQLSNSTYNSFFGSYSGYKNVDGSQNTFIGMSSGYSNKSGSQNTYLGFMSGRSNTTGFSNCFLGTYSGDKNVEGYGNTYLGFESGKNATGNSNIFIGNRAGYNETGNSKLYIDNSSTSSPLIYGDFHKNHVTFNGKISIASGMSNTTIENLRHKHEGLIEDFLSINVKEGSDNPVLISESGRISIGSNDVCLRHTAENDSTYLIVDGIALKYGDPFWHSASDQKLKKNISPLTKSLHTFLNLNFYSYQYKNTNQTRYGILAQEMEDIFPNSMGKLIEEDGTEYLTFNPNNLFYTSLKTTQEIGELTLDQNKKIEQLEKENEQLKSDLKAIKAALKNHGITVGYNNSAKKSLKEDNNNNPHLLLNKPNPFSESTVIPYFLPENTKQAHIIIYDTNAKVIEKFTLPTTFGNGNLELNLTNKKRAKGIYSYSLMVNGNLIDTKKMLWH